MTRKNKTLPSLNTYQQQVLERCKQRGTFDALRKRLLEKEPGMSYLLGRNTETSTLMCLLFPEEARHSLHNSFLPVSRRGLELTKATQNKLNSVSELLDIECQVLTKIPPEFVERCRGVERYQGWVTWKAALVRVVGYDKKVK